MLSSAEESSCLVTNCADLTQLIRNGTNTQVRFSLTTRVLSDRDEYGYGIIVADPSGATQIGRGEAMESEPCPRNGDLIEVTGRLCTPPNSGRFLRAETIRILESDAPYIPPTLTPDEFVAAEGDFAPVRIQGLVRNLVLDEIDNGFAFLILEGRQTVAYIACRFRDRALRLESQRLIGATIIATGVREIHRPQNRRQIGPCLLVSPQSINVISPAPENPFAAPNIVELTDLGPMEVARSGPHVARGTVLAVWQEKQLLMRRNDGGLTHLDLQEAPAPTPGTAIEAVGQPSSDLYNLNLIRAIWRATEDTGAAERPTEVLRSSDILTSAEGGPVFIPRHHGETVQMEGTLVGKAGISPKVTKLYLRDDSGLITVDVSNQQGAYADWELGSRIRATGICIMDMKPWQPHEVFPQISGYMLIARSSGDIELIAPPAWWTPARIWMVVGVLVLIILVILAWCISLRILAERRGRALLRGQLETVKSKLQVEERTRLAVELHDSLSQTLTGVSMEIAAAEDLKGDAPADMATHLSRAGRTLKSCRDELRNCLWDLRSAALDEPDMTKAVLRTLQPQINDARLSVRFNVPRSRLTDNTAHAILRIIRELVVNALRHGGATSVQVAGILDKTGLQFSVSDNGCGFDPDDHPGVLQGHFGLQGVEERLTQLGGKLTIESRPGHGARIVCFIAAHTPTAVGV